MIARFHPLLVHIPIGIILLAALAGWLNRRGSRADLHPALRWVWLLAALSAVVSSITGWLLGHSGAGYDADTINWHQWLNLAMTAVTILVAYSQWRGVSPAATAWTGLLPVALLLPGTYSGAIITHGTTYFTAKAPGLAEDDANLSQDGAADDLPAGQAPAPDMAAVNALRSRGVLVLPVAAGSSWLSVNCINAARFSNQDAVLLEPLAAQLVWLKLSNTAITDSALVSVGKCTHISRLFLDGTHVQGTGLGNLVQLQALRLLNLSGTKLDLNSLATLSQLPELQDIYLYQTGADSLLLANIRTKFTKAHLDAGGYQLPALVTDTARIKAGKAYQN